MVGERFAVDVGPIAHGGSCVARVGEAGGRVVFTRHALPGERVLVEITEGTEGDRFWRGDAVEVLVPSSDRVSPPCPVAGPGGCGGCDFQHVSLPAQRRLKAEVVSEQLRRLAGLDVPVEVEAASPEDTGLRWRTRVRYAATPDGRRGMRRYRSHEVIPVEECLLARHDARGPGPGEVIERVATATNEHEFTVAADGFWQVHPAAPALLVETVLDQLRPRAGERVVDLYAGVGLFSAFLADRVGEEGTVLAVEGDRTAAGHAAANLVGRPACRVVCAPASRAEVDGPVDLVVLDPPRDGARRPVVEMICSWRPRATSYVACDPAALARDLGIFAEHGYRLTALRAFDLFPMTHHVECVALLTNEV